MAWWLLVLLASGAWGIEDCDESRRISNGSAPSCPGWYRALPPLFRLDDPVTCAGLYCLGSFELSGDGPLMDALRNYSSNIDHFNHTQLHRGYCMSARCGGAGAAGFAACVNASAARLGLRASLQRLDYCRTPHTPQPPLDAADLTFAGVVVGILLFNVIGTAYDLLRDSEKNANKYLSAWSLRVNWRRLTANQRGGDPRLYALRPLQGLKFLSLAVVIAAHFVLAEYLGYEQDTQFLESKLWGYFSSFHGSLVVQSFVLVSMFLLGYQLLLQAERAPGMVGVRMWPMLLWHRLTRLVPVYLFVTGLAATWWPRAGGGALWAPLLGGEAAACRRKWWPHLLFLQTFIEPDVKCQIQTWYIAADMQLYAACSLLLLCVLRARRPPALRVLAALFVLVVLANGVLAYVLDLKPLLFFIKPEYLRSMFRGQPSFPLLYAAPWGSLPAALLGLGAAVVLHRLEAKGVKPGTYWWFRAVYQIAVLMTLALPTSGLALAGARVGAGAGGRLPGAVLAALDRPLFAAAIAVVVIGLVTKVDDLHWRFLSWRGFQVLGRLALPVLMLHWNICLTFVAVRSQPSSAGFLERTGAWLGVVFLSLAAALPLALLLELPLQRFLLAFFTRKSHQPVKPPQDTTAI